MSYEQQVTRHMTTVFLIRGFRLGSSAADEDFSTIRDLFIRNGYNVVATDWSWNYMTMSQYITKFKKFYSKHKSPQNIIIGHSFGAFAAMVAAPDLEPDLTILCSLSACFKEDLPRYKGAEEPIVRIGKRRLMDFCSISADVVAKQINDKNLNVTIIYGEYEKQQHPLLVRRCILSSQAIVRSSLHEIPDADHSIFSTPYMQAIENCLSK